jgi:hypothetical protein
MGKGIAVKFRDYVPGLYSYYRSIYKDIPPKFASIHRLEIFRVDAERNVLLFPTKADWRNPSIPEVIEANLHQLADRFEELGITSLGLPAIGCGHNTGQLDWHRVVRPMVFRHLEPLPIPVKLLVN